MFIANFIIWAIFISETHVAHTKPLRRMQSLFESREVLRSQITQNLFFVTVQSAIVGFHMTSFVIEYAWISKL